MEDLSNYTHVKQELTAGAVNYENISESLLVVLFKLVLLRNYVLPKRYYQLKDDAHKDGKPGHTLRVNLLIQHGQDHDRDYSIANEHCRDNYDCLPAKAPVPEGISENELIITADGTRLQGLATEVYAAHEPKVDTKIALSTCRIPFNHHVVGAKEEAMEDHKAHVHTEDWQVLEHLQSAQKGS